MATNTRKVSKNTRVSDLITVEDIKNGNQMYLSLLRQVLALANHTL